MQDPLVIKEMQLAFSKNVNDRVVDLDEFGITQKSFSVLRLEDFHVKTNGIIPPFRQSNFFIRFVKRGAGRRSIGHYTFDIRNNTLSVVGKRVIQTAVYSGKPSGYLISFNPDLFLEQAISYKLLNSKKVLKRSLKPYMVLSEEQANEITGIFEKIIEECDSGFEEKKQMIALKVLELLILCDRYFTEKAQTDGTLKYSDTLEVFNECIETNFSKHRDVHFYADALHTHPNNLNHTVKKATGITAKQAITNRIMIEAKYLLVGTSLSVKEIAYDLGFEDPNYFISFFKKEQQATPLQYRNQPV